MPIELDMIDINSFNEITKAQRASVGEIRVWSDGKKYQKQADGSWVLVEKKKSKPVVQLNSIKSQAGMIMYGKILQKLDEGKAVEFTENGVDYRFSRDEDEGEYLLEDLSNNKSMS